MAVKVGYIKRDEKAAPEPLILVSYKGGTGSGNFGHSGRLGKVGGSGGAVTEQPKSLEDTYKVIKDYPEAPYVQAYTADVYEVINDDLRTNRKSDPEVQEIIDNIDSAFAKTPQLPSETIVYRGVDSVDLKIGQTITDKAFVSTSLNKSKAAEFTATNTMLEIKVGKGSKAMYLDSLSEFDDEKELLLGRGSSFKITGTRTETITHVGPTRQSVDVIVYEAEYVQ